MREGLCYEKDVFNLVLILIVTFTTIELNAQTSLSEVAYSYVDNNSRITFVVHGT